MTEQAAASGRSFEVAPPGPETIKQLMDIRARQYPDEVYCTYDGRSYTFGTIDALVNRVANRLLSLGLKPGDPVALMLPSQPDHIVAILALAKTGLLRLPVNTNLKGASLDFLFELCPPRAVIADRSYAAQLRPTLASHPVEHVIWHDPGDPEASDFAAFLAHPDASSPPGGPAATDVVALAPSSGTTGAPKGVMRTDVSLRAGALVTAALAEIRDGDVMHVWEPLHYGGGVNIVMTSIVRRVRLAMFGRFSASQFWEQVKASGATHIHYLGSIVPVLLKQPSCEAERSHAVRVAWGGGCPHELWPEVERRFGVSVREGYGMTELISFVTANAEGAAGSIGRPASYFDIEVRGDAGPVPTGELGEITIRGKIPGAGFQGYYGNPQATAEATTPDGWLRTGDLGRYDADGLLYFHGRRKDVIRRRGVNIATWEVERVVASHPGVLECALIAVPSALGEDDLKLFVCRKPGLAVSPIDIVQWCEPRMPYFQIPRYIAFADSLPKTPSERIKKNDLSKSIDDCFDLEASGYVVDRNRTL